ncbi:MAG: GGDEF domain-containing protein [Chloroflexota bacterium]
MTFIEHLHKSDLSLRRIALFGALIGAIIALTVSTVTTALWILDSLWFVLIGQIVVTSLAIIVGAYIAFISAYWHRLSITDDTTRLYNRRYLFTRLDKEFQRLQRRHTTLAFAVVEVDNMRTYNNTYGHVAGDVVLFTLAQTLRQEVRRSDIVGRWGGDEFGIVFPNMSLSEALAIAERIRTHIDSLSIDTSVGAIVRVTVSVGVAVNTDPEETILDLVHKADQAMYKAKKQKNTVVSASSS